MAGAVLCRRPAAQARERCCLDLSYLSRVNLSLPCQNVASHSLLARFGHRFVQKMSVTYNRVAKNTLLLKKCKDHAFENLMEDDKKVAKLQRIVAILLKRPGRKMLCRHMIGKGRVVGIRKPQRMSDVLLRYSGIVEISEEPKTKDLCVCPTNAVLELLEEEKKLKEFLIPMAIPRLRKLLMLSSTRTIRLDRIASLKPDLGLPDDFRELILEKHPQYFKIIQRKDDVSPLVELVEWDPGLAVPAIEERRQREASKKGFNKEEILRRAFSFPINYPPSLKLKKGHNVKMKRWQELPYRSPYENTRDLNLQSPEAFKRAVAVIHEYLHLTVEKRSKVERIAHLREDLKLPQKVGIIVLEHPGIFYFSIKGTGQTIFLREAYEKGRLKEKDSLQIVREKFLDLTRVRKHCKLKKRGQKAPKAKTKWNGANIEETEFEDEARDREDADEGWAVEDDGILSDEGDDNGMLSDEGDDNAFTNESSDSCREDESCDSDEHTHINGIVVDKIA